VHRPTSGATRVRVPRFKADVVRKALVNIRSYTGTDVRLSGRRKRISLRNNNRSGEIFPQFQYVHIYRGEFSFSGPWAILNWGPFWKVRDVWYHTNSYYTCSLHSLYKLFQFINILQ